MTNSSVLVLNRNYQPVHVTSVKRAFTLLYIGAARVIRLCSSRPRAGAVLAEQSHSTKTK